MSTHTYQSLAERIKADAAEKPEFGIETDHSYIECSAWVQKVSWRWFKRGVEPYKLKGLWSISKTFRTHWRGAKKDTSKHMAWVAFQFAMTLQQVKALVLAWMCFHGRRPSPDEIRREIVLMVEQVWIDVQPSLRQKKDGKNAKKRERRKKKMTKMGRPKDTSPESLENRIIEQLRSGRCTPDKLADDLDATGAAIQSQLRRLYARKIVERFGRGLYQLRDSGPLRQVEDANTTVQCRHSESLRPPETRARVTQPSPKAVIAEKLPERPRESKAPLFSADELATLVESVDTEVAYYSEPPSCPPPELPSCKPNLKYIVSEPPEMKTAEPGWWKR